MFQTRSRKKPFLANTTLGIQYVLAGDEVQKACSGSPNTDFCVPDLVVGTKVGMPWVHRFRSEDHGGSLPQGLNVPTLAYNPKIKVKSVNEKVRNRQVTTLLLQALGLPLALLDGSRSEKMPSLPGVFEGVSAFCGIGCGLRD